MAKRSGWDGTEKKDNDVGWGYKSQNNSPVEAASTQSIVKELGVELAPCSPFLFHTYHLIHIFTALSCLLVTFVFLDHI